jgi:3-hydroxyisobutyrate dehydrogenase
VSVRPTLRIGVVGLGVMGELIVRKLLNDTGGAGGPAVVHVHDLDPARVELAVAAGAVGCGSASAVALASDVVLLSLPGPDAVRDVVLGSDGVIAAGVTGTALVDTSTVSLELSLQVHAACRGAGIDFVDAPVTGRPPSMIVFAGGHQSAIERCRPVLERIAREVAHVGPPGAGTVCKLANQYLLYDSVAAFSEAVSLIERVGYDGRRGGAALRLSPMLSRLQVDVATRIVEHRFADADGAPLRLVAKDMALLAELARLAGSPTRADSLRAAFADAMDRGLGDEHFAAVSEVIRPVRRGAAPC